MLTCVSVSVCKIDGGGGCTFWTVGIEHWLSTNAEKVGSVAVSLIYLSFLTSALDALELAASIPLSIDSTKLFIPPSHTYTQTAINVKIYSVKVYYYCLAQMRVSQRCNTLRFVPDACCYLESCPKNGMIMNFLSFSQRYLCPLIQKKQLRKHRGSQCNMRFFFIVVAKDKLKKYIFQL